MNNIQLAGFIIFIIGALVSFVPFMVLIGIPLMVLGLAIMLGSVILERYNDIKKGDLK